MQVGFAGLGRMGVPMARDKADTLAVEIGAFVADVPEGLTENSDVVVTVLADDNNAVSKGSKPSSDLFCRKLVFASWHGTHPSWSIH